jgi:hypothetical protein
LEGVVEQRQRPFDTRRIAAVVLVFLQRPYSKEAWSGKGLESSSDLRRVLTFLALEARARQGALGACGGVRPRKGTGIKAHGANVGRQIDSKVADRTPSYLGHRVTALVERGSRAFDLEFERATQAATYRCFVRPRKLPPIDVSAPTLQQLFRASTSNTSSDSDLFIERCALDELIPRAQRLRPEAHAYSGDDYTAARPSERQP